MVAGRGGLLLFAAFGLATALSPGALGATTLTVGASDVSQDSALVTWSRTQDLCFTTYEVQWREVGASQWFPAASISDSSRTSHRVGGLQPSRTYEARVVDVDCLGSQPSDSVGFSTKAPLIFGLTDSALWTLIILAVVLAAAAGFLLLRRRARERQLRSAQVLIPLDAGGQNVAKCSSCGKLVATEFCPSCGTKNPKRPG